LSSESVKLAATARELLASVRAKRPLIQCVTNFVSMDLVANALHALGASPAMASAPEEANEFAAIANAIVCNIGTLSRDRVECLEAVAGAARAHGKPWVLDPVGVGATRFRGETAQALLRHRPTVIRGNASEIMALARLFGIVVGDENAKPRGVDAVHASEAAEPAALALARMFSCVIIVSGRVDLVTNGALVARVNNGAPVMTRVTAMGCALSGATGAFLAVTGNPFEASVAAVAVFGVAGELAAVSGAGPGTFRVNFLDRLHDLSPDALRTSLKIDVAHARA
jgi:hydroxyethylthiazole kinase